MGVGTDDRFSGYGEILQEHAVTNTIATTREPATVTLAKRLQITMVIAVNVTDLQGLVVHHDDRSRLHPIHAHLLEGQCCGCAGRVLIQRVGKLNFQWLPRFGELFQSSGRIGQKNYLCDV